MSEYITDPELLKKLNGTTSEGYVTDPALLAELNKKTIGQRLKEEVRSVADQGVTGVTDVANRGLVGGILGAPVDLINLGIQGVHAATNAAMKPFGYENKWSPSAAPVGGSEWFGQQMQNMGMVSGERRPILESAAGLAPVVPSAVRGAYTLGKEVAAVPKNIAKGALINEPGTSLIKVGDHYVTPQAVERYKLGYLSKEEISNPAKYPENFIKKEDLFSSPVDKAALKIAGGSVPARGKIAEATGERIAQDLSNPYKLATEIAFPALTGIPVPLQTTGRAVQGLADAYLSRKYNFDPALLTALKKDTGIPPAAAVPPTTPPAAAVPPTTPPAPKTPPAGLGPVAPQTPAQINAQAAGITPPMTAEQSGFTQTLQELSKKNSTPSVIKTTETTPTGVKTTEVGPAIPETTGPAFEFTPAPKTDWQGDWYKKSTEQSSTGRSPGMTQFVEALRKLPADEMPNSGADILAQIRARKPQAAPEEIIAPVKPSGPSKVSSVNVNPEKDTDVISKATSLLDIRKKLEGDPLGQLKTELELSKQANRSAAQQARGDLVQDIKDYTNVTKQNNKLTYDKDSLNELADNLGKKINWTNAPDITNMPLKQGRKEIRKFVYGELKGTDKIKQTTLNDLFEEMPTSTMSMMTKSSKQIPEEYASKELSMALLKGSGEWKQGKNTLKVITTPSGNMRLQVKDPTGKVIDERYLQ